MIVIIAIIIGGIYASAILASMLLDIMGDDDE